MYISLFGKKKTSPFRRGPITSLRPGGAGLDVVMRAKGWMKWNPSPGVSENRWVTPPNHPFLIGFSIIFTNPFWGYHYFWKHPNPSISPCFWDEVVWKKTQGFLKVLAVWFISIWTNYDSKFLNLNYLKGILGRFPLLKPQFWGLPFPAVNGRCKLPRIISIFTGPKSFQHFLGVIGMTHPKHVKFWDVLQ